MGRAGEEGEAGAALPRGLKSERLDTAVKTIATWMPGEYGSHTFKSRIGDLVSQLQEHTSESELSICEDLQESARAQAESLSSDFIDKLKAGERLYPLELEEFQSLCMVHAALSVSNERQQSTQ